MATKIISNKDKTVTDTENKNEKGKDKPSLTDYANLTTGIFSGIASVITPILNYMKDDNTTKLELEKYKMESENNKIQKDISELKEKLKSKEEEEKKKKKQAIQNEQMWNSDKNDLIDSILSQIKYQDLIKETFNQYSENFISDIDKKISTKIFNNNFKESFAELIQNKHTSILDSIKNDIKEIETLNFMIAGMSGAGKSSLINAILKEEKATVGNRIDPETQVFEQFSNPEKVPGITVYDTFGVEPSSVDRNIIKTKEMIQKTFDENLKDPNASLHGIIYCIKNCEGDVRIFKEEIKFIQEISKIYGDYDILTIALTQTEEPELAENRKNELRKALNNENIEIIPILVKDKPIIFKGKVIETYHKYGLDTLINIMKKNTQKIVFAYFKKLAKIQFKEKYFKNIDIQYNEIKTQLEKNEFENSLSEECNKIIKALFDSVNVNYKDLEKVLEDYKENLFLKILESLKKENKEKSMNKINEKYLNNNAKCDNQLVYNSSVEEYNFMAKLEKYFECKINEELNKILLEKASLRFLEKSKEYFGEIICENIRDEEIREVVDSNLDKILKKINNE